MATERPGWEIPGDPAPESRFIGPDERCPHPDAWSSTDGDSTELEVTELIAGLVRGLQPRLVVETGAAFGQTTRAICTALDRNGRGLLAAFETDRERYAALELHDRLIAYRKSSADADLDFAFLDSFYECRIPEFHHLRRWMRPGTVVAFHDSRPGAGGHRIPSGRSLREEIEHELVAPGSIRAIDLPTPRGLTLGEVL